MYKLGQPREAVNGAGANDDVDWKPKSEGGTTIDIYKREHDGRDDIYGRNSDEKQNGEGGSDGGDSDRPKMRVVGVDW